MLFLPIILLPLLLLVGVICAAPMYNGWYRAQVVATYEDTDYCDIKYTDYGGYAKIQSCQLRQIRSDFTSLPFQAVECYLANVIPPKGKHSALCHTIFDLKLCIVGLSFLYI